MRVSVRHAVGEEKHQKLSLGLVGILDDLLLLPSSLAIMPPLRYKSPMGASSEFKLISSAVEFTLGHAQEVEANIFDALETSSAVRYINVLRMLTMQSTIISIGTLQAFEGLLQQKNGWNDAFKELDIRLRATGYGELADRFLDYRNAVNVLKHGKGRSYEKLLARRSALPFEVKEEGQRYFDEGDVSEGIRLVNADHRFVRQCSDIIQEVVDALRSPHPIAPRGYSPSKA
jgi:hypothetical protein